MALEATPPVGYTAESRCRNCGENIYWETSWWRHSHGGVECLGSDLNHFEPDEYGRP